MRFTLDTNILVYAVDRDAGPRHDIARQLVDAATQGDCVLTLQTLGEFFHATTRKQHLTPARAMALAEAFGETFGVHAADAACLSMAMQAVVSDGLSFWDAMLWATAQRAGCRAIVTEHGQDGRLLGGVYFLDPFRPGGAAGVMARLGLA